MRPLMVQGCTSWAGKSLLTTALCRWASDLGIDAAPFKAQNMANNARVTPGGEIGVAQWLQARAARVEPSTDHNPVLLKPEADTRSQVVVDDDARARILGFVLNRFRGDPTLLEPGPALLQERTGVPCIGLVPMLRHGLPDEDGARRWPPPATPGPHPRVAIVAGPAASNLDEFAGVAAVAEVVWARRPADLAGADLVVLGGSKHVAHDRSWLAATGLDHAVVHAAEAGTRVLGICGGAMLLGAGITDEDGVEGGEPTTSDGLGLLPLTTHYDPDKLLRHGPVTFAGGLPSPWRPLGARTVERTYEIRHGRIDSPATPAVHGAGTEALGWADGNVMATTAHGLLEDPALVAALLDTPPPPSLDDVLDELTAAVVPPTSTPTSS